MTHEANSEDGTDDAFVFVRNGHDRAQPHDLQTSDVEGATVYGREDESIGTVKSLHVDEDGQIAEAVIDVAGFAGMGTHSVLLPFDQLTVLRQTNGGDIRVHLDTTKEKLEAMTHHAG